MLAILLSLSACSGGGDDPVDPAPKPEVSKSEITMDATLVSNGLSFGSTEGDQTVSFTASENWTLSVASTLSGATWCKASATSGSKGTASVKFTVEANTGYEDRMVSVTIKSGTASKTFTVTQKGADALLVTTSKYEIPQSGGQIEVEVKSNLNYQLAVSEDAKSWITEGSGRSLTTRKHSFTISPNEEVDKREGTITFKSGDKSEVVRVYQSGGAIILLSQDEYTVSSEGDTLSVDVKSNVDYGVELPDVDWITDISSSRGMSSHTLEYVVHSNSTYDSRSAFIVFYDRNSDLKDTLKVVQVQKDAIVISEKNVKVAKEGGTVEVKVNSNVDFEVQIPSDVTWITKTDSRALTEKSIFLKVAENASEKPRNASITITNKECMLIDTLFVTQQGSSNVKLTYSTNSEELEGWSEGLFCNDGTYYMAKPSEGNACLVTIGSFLTEENCIIYIDENRHVREVFSVDKIFTFNNYTDDSVDISYFDENNVRKTETVDRSSGSTSRSSNAEANGINLGLNMWSIKEAVNDIAQNETTYKYGRGWQSYLLNVFNALGTALEIGGGPENGLFNNTITDWIGHIDNSISLGEMGVQLVESLKIKNPQLKPGPGGPAVWAITAWLGFRATYLELYNEHIEAYYGNSLASIANITYENGGLSFDLQVSGYEDLYNMECGVIVKQSNLPVAPPVGKFPSDIETTKVTRNGNYPFFVGNKEKDESYWCYPFLISQSRDPLWKGAIGEISGPLVRYGQAVKYEHKEKIEAIDLGLSVSWATCNLGAEKPEEYGNYFAFGEIEAKSSYSWENWNNPKTLNLSGEQDAATQQLGSGWRMPTRKECEELLQECSWKLIAIEGVKGYEVTGKNGNSIFLPLTGSYTSKEENYEARYRTSEAKLDGSGYDDPATIVMELQQDFTDTEMDSAGGWVGHPIRPVLLNIVGKWKDKCYPACYYIFKEDGTGSYSNDNEPFRTFEWKMENDKVLTIERITSDGETDVDVVEIEWISSNKFIMETEYTRVD